MSEPDTSNSELADTILQDHGFAQKILRIVNTVAHAQYNQLPEEQAAIKECVQDGVAPEAAALAIQQTARPQARSRG